MGNNSNITITFSMLPEDSRFSLDNKPSLKVQATNDEFSKEELIAALEFLKEKVQSEEFSLESSYIEETFAPFPRTNEA
jgi:hypothetical protein